MACTCKVCIDWEPYGDTYVERETIEVCDECAIEADEVEE